MKFSKMAASSSSEEDTTFGSDTPYAEPAWYRHPSPYYHEGHRQFRATLRSFVDDEVIPFVEEWEEEGIPRTVYKRAAEVGLLPAMVGWPEDVPDVAPRPSAYDGFFSLIAMVSLVRFIYIHILWMWTCNMLSNNQPY